MNWPVMVIVFQIATLTGVIASLFLFYRLDTGRYDDHLYRFSPVRLVVAALALLGAAAAFGLIAGMVIP